MAFDLEQILREIAAASDALPGDWIEESWRDPDGFAAAMTRHNTTSVAPGSKSRIGTGIDLGHDLVLRHLPSERAALRWFDKRSGWQALTYSELERRSGARARAWLGQGVQPGDVVALVHAIGPEWAVSLLAALRLGVVFTLVPPNGNTFVRHRLQRIKPKRIATEALYLPLVKEFGDQVLSTSDVSSNPLLRSASSTYVPDKPVALFCSPMDPDGSAPVALSAQAAWLGATRDALLTFGLQPDDNLAAPGFDIEQHQPALIFAAWLHGAAYVHIEPEELARDPALLHAHPLRAVGISNATRQLLMRSGVRPPRPWNLWFRNPEEPFDGEAWRRFVKEQDIKTVPHMNVVIDSAAGGSVLASRRQRGQTHMDVLPAPGTRWLMIDATKSGPAGPPATAQGAKSVTDMGMFASIGDTPRQGHIILTRRNEGSIYAGTTQPRRAGRSYPASEVSKVIEALPFVKGATVVPLPSGSGVYEWYFTLVVFTGSESPEAAAQAAGERRDRIRRHIAVELGAGALPDRMELFPLYPRRNKDGVNNDWCTMQYITGALHRKAGDQAFQLLTRLRALCEADSNPGAKTAGASS